MTDSIKPVKQAPFSGFAGFGGGLGTLSSAASGPTYVDDVFAINLYRNDSNSEEFNNGLDMSGEGGLIITKYYDATTDWGWVDSERGVSKVLKSNSYVGEATEAWIQSFDDDGFTHGSYIGTGDNYGLCSWSFRKAPGFFDVVTWTGNSVNGRQIAHSLGSTPGMILVKRTSNGANWEVWHNSFGVNEYMALNSDGQKYTSGGPWNSTAPTSTHFTISSDSDVNLLNETYVAYLFGHNDASFGTDSDEAIIKCGTYTGGGNTSVEVNLGFEPQFVMTKSITSGTGWCVYDNMRGVVDSNQGDMQLLIDDNDAQTNENRIDFYPQGFRLENAGAHTNASGVTFVYMAIRRPHKPPTAGTEVFAVDYKTAADTGTTPQYTSNFPVDFLIRRNNITSADSGEFIFRLTNSLMYTTNDNAEVNGGTTFTADFSYNNGWGDTAGGDSNDYAWMFKRAPGFLDCVTYTGNDANGRNIAHNLGAVPELMFIKNRTDSSYSDWTVYYKSATAGGANKYLSLNSNSGETTHSTVPWNNTDPTSTQFTVYNSWIVNKGSSQYIATLFASLDGVSKVGTYSGTGNNINVDCGFSAGARFVLIKRTDSSGDWYLWDSSRGITSGNDPWIKLNSSVDDQNSTSDYIDPLNAGFTITSSAPSAINTNGGTYLFLAVA